MILSIHEIVIPTAGCGFLMGMWMLQVYSLNDWQTPLASNLLFSDACLEKAGIFNRPSFNDLRASRYFQLLWLWFIHQFDWHPLSKWSTPLCSLFFLDDCVRFSFISVIYMREDEYTNGYIAVTKNRDHLIGRLSFLQSISSHQCTAGMVRWSRTNSQRKKYLLYMIYIDHVIGSVYWSRKRFCFTSGIGYI